MATYLTLCQAVARESGTFPNVGDPAAVAGVTGRLLRLTNWVNDAWQEIQREQTRWQWMLADAVGDATIGTTQYTGASLGVSERFGNWELFSDHGECEVSLWDADVGRADEQYLKFFPWPVFRRHYRSGAALQQTGKPTACTLAPDGQLTIYPAADKVYKLRCQYTKSPQALTADDDVPELPVEFHDAIKWKALVLLGMFDEATTQAPMWQFKYARVMEHLRNKQLPQMMPSEPLV